MVRIELLNSGGSPTTPVSPSSSFFGPNTFPYPPQESAAAAYFPSPAVYWPAPSYYHYQIQSPYPYEYGFGYGSSPYGYHHLPPAPAQWYDLNQQPQPEAAPGFSSRKSGGVSGPRLQHGTTTLMIRNLPTKLRRHEMMNLLDEHCKELNKTAPRLAVKRYSAYDFLYLPFDFTRGGNLGYAFVNFTTPGAAFRFFKSWNGKSWINFYKCSKICAITRADIQGKEASKRHLEKCKFFCDTEEFLPVEFLPPRSGYNTAVIKMKTFGIWVAKDVDKNCKKIWRKKE